MGLTYRAELVRYALRAGLLGTEEAWRTLRRCPVDRGWSVAGVASACTIRRPSDAGE
jgi:hypothetical protein